MFGGISFSSYYRTQSFSFLELELLLTAKAQTPALFPHFLARFRRSFSGQAVLAFSVKIGQKNKQVGSLNNDHSPRPLVNFEIFINSVGQGPASSA